MPLVNLNAAQKAAMKQLKGVPYGIIPRRTAHALIIKRVVQEVTIQPEPRDGVACRLTSLGQSLI